MAKAGFTCLEIIPRSTVSQKKSRHSKNVSGVSTRHLPVGPGQGLELRLAQSAQSSCVETVASPTRTDNHTAHTPLSPVRADFITAALAGKTSLGILIYRLKGKLLKNPSYLPATFIFFENVSSLTVYII